MNWINELPAILLVLLITGFVSWSSNLEKGFFPVLYKWVPPILLLYLLPTIATNTGMVKPGNSIRVLAMNTILPLSLIMLTAIIHVPDLLRVTRKGLLVFLIGTIGIVIGGPLALRMVGFFHPDLLQQQGADAPWRGLVCITGSWINGTPGQLSMKEVYGSSEELFLTSLAADVILQNAWLFLLLYSVKIQKWINRWLVGTQPVDFDMIDNEEEAREKAAKKISIPPVKQWIILAVTYAFVIILSGFFADLFAKNMGSDDTNPWSFLTKKSLWLILFSTSFGVGLSFTNLFKKSIIVWTRLGNYMILLVIATIGLQLDLKNVTINASFFLIGSLWLLIHLIVLLIGAKFLKAPWHYIAIGSQANIGGPASASVVAASFHPSMVSLGILLGVLSNLIGNYANLVAGIIFQWVTG
jgi:uncharacterized membrane protein